MTYEKPNPQILWSNWCVLLGFGGREENKTEDTIQEVSKGHGPLIWDVAGVPSVTQGKGARTLAYRPGLVLTPVTLCFVTDEEDASASGVGSKWENWCIGWT